MLRVVMIISPLLLLVLLSTSAIGFRGFDNFCYIQVDLKSCWVSGAIDVKIHLYDFGTNRKYSLADPSNRVVCHPVKCVNGLSSREMTIVATAIFHQEAKIVPTDPTNIQANRPLYTDFEQCFTGPTDVIVQCPSPSAGVHAFNDIIDLDSMECGSNEALYPVSKQFDNKMKAQTQKFECKTSMKLSHTTCQWSEKVNSWESNAFYQCPLNSVMTGVKSYYDTEDKQPHFQFKCCSRPRYSTTGCKLSVPNEDLAKDTMVVGAFVPAKDNRNEEDWKFLICNYDANQSWNNGKTEEN